ncbi:MAG TPA: hypothetical protein VKQ29_15175 [Aliidongia sp.]|nr:hypothetical protein [Aliidongia sp.]
MSQDGCRRLVYELRWRGRMNEPKSPDCLEDLARAPGVIALKWATHAPPPL